MQTTPNNQTAKNTIEVKPQSPANIEQYNRITYSIVTFPIVLLLAVLAYKRYRVIVHKRRIAMLERIWLLNINRKIR
ncbi:MAG: hypothetical protein ACFB02_20170 [Mastigocoleus sp.]